MGIKRYRQKPVEVKAGRVVAVLDYEGWGSTYTEVKLQDGGRVFTACSQTEPYPGDYLIFEDGGSWDGYICPAAVFLERYSEIDSGE